MNKQTSAAKVKEVPPSNKTEKQQAQSPSKTEKPAMNKAEIIKPEKPTKGSTKAPENIYLTQPNSKTPREDLSPKKPENVLVSSGLLNAYDYLQDQFCKHGFPKGNVFEYAAVTILKYERKLKGKEAWKKLEEREKEIEKAKKYIDLGNPPTGKSPRNEKSPQARDKSPTQSKNEDPKLQGKTTGKNRSKSPPPREEEIKGKTKPGNKSPPPKDEVIQPTKGKGDQSPPRKNQPAPPGKDAGKTIPAEDKNAKKNEPMSNKAGGGVKKK